MLKALKVTFLFIGTIIGAGFASGREIALFFGDITPLNVALSGLFMAALSGLFMFAGKTARIPDNYAVHIAVFIAAAASCCAMIAGSEYILSSLFGIPMMGLVMGILAAFTVVRGIEKIKIVNTLLIPTLIIMLLVIYFKGGVLNHTGSLSLSKPVMYSGLDVLLGGMVISREGKKLSGKQIIMASAGIAFFLALILFVLQNIVLEDKLNSSMPVFAVANNLGLRVACGILIAIAIFTTMLSSMDLMSEQAGEWLRQSVNRRNTMPLSKRRRGTAKRTHMIAMLANPKNKALLVFGTLLIAYPISFAGFEFLVDTTYPFISFAGILFTVWTIVRMILIAIKNKKSIHKKGASVQLAPISKTRLL